MFVGVIPYGGDGLRGEPEGIGHCPHMDDPKRVAERITEFAHTI